MTTQMTRKVMRSALAALALAGSVIGNAQDSSATQAREPIVQAAWTNVTAKNRYTTNGGVVFNDNLVIQSDIGATVRGVSVDMWMNYDTKNRMFNEQDFTLAKSFDTNHVAIDTSVGLWTYPNTSYSNAKTVGISFSPKKLPLGLAANLSFRKLWCNESHGFDTGLDVSKRINLTDKLNATLGVNLDYNHRFYSDQSGFACTNPYIRIGYNISDALSVAVGAKSQRAQKSFEGATSQNVYSLSLDLNLAKLAGGRK